MKTGISTASTPSFSRGPRAERVGRRMEALVSAHLRTPVVELEYHARRDVERYLRAALKQVLTRFDLSGLSNGMGPRRTIKNHGPALPPIVIRDGEIGLPIRRF